MMVFFSLSLLMLLVIDSSFLIKKLVGSHKTPLGTVFPPITTPGAYLIFKIEGVRRAE